MNQHEWSFPIGKQELVTMYWSEWMTQKEIAQRLGVSQKRVFTAMRRWSIPRRRQVKRDQQGDRNSSWRGQSAGYAAMHLRVAALRGQPSECEMCGTTSRSTRYEWANMTGALGDPMDYRRLCRSCHRKVDNSVANISA